MDTDDIKFCIVVFGVVAVMVIGALSFIKHQTRIQCEGFSQTANRETRYVEYSYWSFDCLTPDKGDKWISTEMLRSIND